MLLATAICQRGRHFLRGGDCDMPSVIFFDESERKIDGRSQTGRGIKRTVLNKWPFVTHPQFWEALRDIAGESPVGGNLTPIQQSRWGQAVDASADACDTPGSFRTCQDPIRNPFGDLGIP